MHAPRTLLSRIPALSAMICMVALVFAGFGSAQATVQVLEHQISGDQQTVDGGWVANCVEVNGECQGHLTADEPFLCDMLAIHHHHHNTGDVAQGLASNGPELNVDLNISNLDLGFGDALPIAGLDPARPYQPPRA